MAAVREGLRKIREVEPAIGHYACSMMHFRVTGLSPQPFSHLCGLSDDELVTFGVKRYIVDRESGFPDRIEMRDLKPGECVLLVNYEHQPALTPYRSSHAIYIGEHSTKRYDRIDEIPDVMRVRQLSLRGFDDEGMMVDADVTDGSQVESLINHLLSNPRVAYIHAHNAKPGCYSGRIERASP